MKHLYLLLLYSFLFPSLLSAHGGSGPIEFVENKGQWDGPFLYKSITSHSDIYLEPNGFTYVIGASNNYKKILDYKYNKTKEQPVLSFHAYKVVFEGMKKPTVVGSKPQQHYYNYFLGSDPSRWKSGLHPFYNVDYRGLYNGIDMHIASEGDRLKYDFIVQPGSDPAVIRLRFDGVNGLELSDGNLLVKTGVGNVVEHKPYAYQVVNGERREVPCKYHISNNVVTYSFPNGYNKGELLIIDPTVAFATFTGSTADNFGFCATYDNAGNFYAGGFANGPGYPFTTGFFQQTFAGGGSGGNAYPTDMAISKFNPGGTAMIYSTYIGGRDNDQPHSMIVDNNGDLIIAGRTYSDNYPTANAYDNTFNGGADIVVTKLNAAGTALIGSTYIGGTGDDGVNIAAEWGTVNSSLKKNYGDDARSEVIIDNADNIYVAAATRSSNFPVVNGANAAGQQDGVVFKFNNNLSSLIWSTHIGGAADDAAYVLSLDKSQARLYVAGGTASAGLGTAGVYQSTIQGGIDGFIARFLNSGAYTRERFTYIGTGDYDQCYGLQMDADDNVYSMGQTNGNFPVVNAPYSNAGANQFVIKLDANLTAPGFSTVFGSTNAAEPNISPVAFLVDTCQNIYISGWGGTVIGHGGNTNGMPVLLGTPAPTPVSANTDGSDFYFIVFARNVARLLFAGYYGQNNAQHGEHVDGGTSRFDKNGVIYQAICGGCGGTSLPTTPGVWSATNRSTNCNLAALKIEFNLGAVNAKAEVYPNASICLGESVQFRNSSANAVSYEWDFGDGSQGSSQSAPTYSYSSVGKFKVRMIAINPDACKVRDTAYLDIVVDTIRITPAFTLVPGDTCFPFRAAVQNNSTYSKTPGSATFTRFVWNYGDGNTATGTNPPPHFYNNPGKYTVSLVMIDSTACNSPDTISQEIEFTSDSVRARFDLPENICERNNISFTSNSIKAKSIFWDFGDGFTSTETSVLHKYAKAGTYTIKLVAYNLGTCNKADSMMATFTVNGSPTADFVHSPIVPETNVPLTVTNRSKDAALYKWSYGDGTGSDVENPLPHQYKRTGTYTVCLVATNLQGCSDTICKPIETDVYPLADIPTAFSPNGDGNNDILYVMGAGIELMDLRIYNRWGEQIFHSADQSKGWDGTYKGKPQEMEAYAYTLNITFIDGTTLQKRGNITLIR
jgi:gliding motility-associated-like protein